MDRTEDRIPFEAAWNALDLGRALGAPANAGDRELRLYARYVRVLALLCECAPYVDEASYSDQIDEALADACSNYPLEWRRNGRGVEIAPRGSEAEPRAASALCGS